MTRALPQTSVYSGRLRLVVRDMSTRKALHGVTCRIYSSDHKFYAYGISGVDGQMSVSVKQSDILEFSFIGYENLSMKVRSLNVNKTNIVELKAKEISLREISIKAPLIRTKGDTLIYNVKSFRGAEDRHLEDVLRKLPGVRVAENGAVSVQGKAVNKFYIEGMDLMGTSYNQATRNMPIDAVASIEVLENHQPVKMLDGKQFSDRAAINIVMDKNYKARPFGEAEAGAGVSPAIWDNKVFLAQIMNDSQFLITGKMNNDGTDLSEETIEHIDVADVDAYEPIPSSLLSTATISQTLPQERYVCNKSYSAGANGLFKLSASSTLRLNALLYGDCSSYGIDIDNHYGGMTPVSISEDKRFHNDVFRFVPVVKYEMNSDHAFISDELRGSFSRYTSTNSIVSNESLISEKVNNRPSYVQNYLLTSFNIGGKIVQAKSLIRYLDREEKLNDTSDTIGCHNAAERYATKSFTTKNLLKTTLPLFNNYLDLGANVYYTNNLYGFMGDMRYQNLKISVKPGYYMKYGNASNVYVEFPFEWSDACIAGLNQFETARKNFSFSPAFNISQTVNSMIKVELSASVNTYNAMPWFYSMNALRTGYRSIVKVNNEIFKNVARRVSLRLRYRNLAEMLFLNMAASYSDEKRESFTAYEYTDSLNIITQTKGQNHYKKFIASAMADKSFTNIGLSIKAGINYELNSGLLSQSDILTENHSHVLSARLCTTFKKIQWLRLMANVEENIYWEKNELYETDKLSSFNMDVSMFIFLSKGLELKLKYQNSVNEISSCHYKNCSFLDGELNYKINNVWALGISVTNLLAERTYVITRNQGLDTFYSSLPLRGRETLFHVVYRF